MATRPSLNIAVAKKKNKASKYNENFELMMDFVDATLGECKDYVDAYMPSQTGQGGKYLTTNGTSASWVNLGGNFPYSKYIDGLVITKSNSTTIGVSAGSCYDSTFLKIMTLANSTTQTNSSQAASTTYYVFLTANSALSSYDILIGTSSTPTLPSGSAYYRLIGSYITNSSSEIEAISGLSANSITDINTIANSLLPDYSAGTSVQIATTNVSKTITKTSYVEYVLSATSNTAGRFYINDELYWGMGYQYTIGIVYQKILEPGTYNFRVGSTGHTQTITIYPLKGQ